VDALPAKMKAINFVLFADILLRRLNHPKEIGMFASFFSGAMLSMLLFEGAAE